MKAQFAGEVLGTCDEINKICADDKSPVGLLQFSSFKPNTYVYSYLNEKQQWKLAVALNEESDYPGDHWVGLLIEPLSGRCEIVSQKLGKKCSGIAKFQFDDLVAGCNDQKWQRHVNRVITKNRIKTGVIPD